MPCTRCRHPRKSRKRLGGVGKKTFVCLSVCLSTVYVKKALKVWVLRGQCFIFGATYPSKSDYCNTQTLPSPKKRLCDVSGRLRSGSETAFKMSIPPITNQSPITYRETYRDLYTTILDKRNGTRLNWTRGKTSENDLVARSSPWPLPPPLRSLHYSATALEEKRPSMIQVPLDRASSPPVPTPPP